MTTPTPIEDQLRMYADSIDQAETAISSVTPLTSARSSMRNQRGVWLLTAAAAAVVAVALIVVGTRDPVAVETGDFVDEPQASVAPFPTEPVTDGTGTAETVAAESVRRYLMADPEAWVVVEDWAIPEGETGPVNPDHLSAALWVWRLDDGGLVIFHAGEGVAYGEPVPLADAEIVSEIARSFVGWQTPTGRVGLVGLDMGPDELRSIAEAIDLDPQNPTFPGATLVLHEPEQMTAGTDNEQIEFAPLSGTGTAQLQNQISASARPASLGSLYRTLSNLDQVVETQIAGADGFIVDGSSTGFGLSYALVAIDGWLYQWQSTSPDNDFAAFIQSIAEVSETEWNEAVGRKDTNVRASVEAQIEQAGITPDDIAPAIDLPRYVLPEPWTIDWVTDMGIWTDEQRTQRAAVFQANTTTSPVARRSIQQSFSFTAAGETDPGLYLADLQMNVVVFDDDPPFTTDTPQGSTPVSALGLTGFVSPEALGRTNNPDALNSATLEGDTTRVFISSQTASSQDLVDFVESLTPRAGGDVAGFDTTDARFELVAEESYNSADDTNPNSLSAMLAPPTNWLASWTHAENPSRSIHMTIEQLTLDELRVMLGTYQYVTDESLEVTTDGESVTVRSDRPDVAVRYNSATQLLVVVTVTNSAEDSPADIIDSQLVEVGLDEWIPIVEPYNADPLNPR